VRRDLVVQDDRLAALKINRNDVAVGQRDRVGNTRRPRQVAAYNRAENEQGGSGAGTGGEKTTERLVIQYCDGAIKYLNKNKVSQTMSWWCCR